jgi:hypothetical protein
MYLHGMTDLEQNLSLPCSEIAPYTVPTQLQFALFYTRCLNDTAYFIQTI